MDATAGPNIQMKTARRHCSFAKALAKEILEVTPAGWFMESENNPVFKKICTVANALL